MNVRRLFVIDLARREALRSPERSVARASRWSTAMRAGACALIAMACCGAFGLLVAGVRGVRSPSTFFMSSSREKLPEEIEATYAKRGVQPETMTKVIGTFRQTCDKNGQQEVHGLPALQPLGNQQGPAYRLASCLGAPQDQHGAVARVLIICPRLG